jgi:hypothetical protein
MPQISASVNHGVINAISELASENKPIEASFSTMVNALLSTHPQVLDKIKQINKRSNSKTKK